MVAYCFAAKHTPRDGATSVLTVAPSFVPGLGNISTAAPSHRDNPPSQTTSYPSPLPTEALDMRSSQQYNETRVSQKEFGVQAGVLKLVVTSVSI